jgi:diadenosine tetraphosphate (Ap4A) HIT family hydrolase
MNDYQFPWVILVPERINVSEIYELNTADQTLLIQENHMAQKLAEAFHADKMNVAALEMLLNNCTYIILFAIKPIKHGFMLFGENSAMPYTQSQFKNVEERLIAALF